VCSGGDRYHGAGETILAVEGAVTHWKAGLGDTGSTHQSPSSIVSLSRGVWSF